MPFSLIHQGLSHKFPLQNAGVLKGSFTEMVY